jgi:hypothetical protein
MITDKEVMGLVGNSGKPKENTKLQQARQQLVDYMSHYDVSAEDIKKLGQIGMMVLKDKALYPMFVQQARQMQIPGADKLSGTPDFQQVGNMISLSKLLEVK